VAAVALTACSSGHGAAPTTTAVDRRAAEAYVAATKRSLEGTWKVDEHFERTATDGRKITADQHRVQRPPDHLLEAGGTVDAERNGRKLACATDAANVLRCSDAGPADPFQAGVDTAIATLTNQVEGDNALYAVRAAASGCFTLRLLVPDYVAPPYGTDATLCFDASTGAPVRTEIHRPEGSDITTATAVSGTVTDADLAPPPAG
jgi:hypothetical protein